MIICKMYSNSDVYRMICSALCLTLIIFNYAQGTDITDNTMTILRKEKMLGYDPNSRPVIDQNHNITVYLGLSIVGLDINDIEQTMTLVSYITLTWKDEYLTWNPADYNNIGSLHFDSNEVWIPDIALYNSAKGAETVPKSTLPVLVYPDGTIFWVPPFTAEVFCQMDLTNWPSDKHTCDLQFGSWTHHGELINLNIFEHFNKSGIAFKYYKMNNRWQVLSFDSTRNETEYGVEAYPFIDFRITVQRQASDHATFITQTTLALMLVVLCSYLLPLRYHLSRLLLHLTALSLLITCNFVIFLSLPSSGGGVPIVVRYFSGTIILTTLSLMCTVGLASALSSGDGSSQSGVKKKLASLFGGFSRTANNDESHYMATNEVVYSNLEEELRDMSENPSTESSNGTPATIVTRTVAKASNGTGFFRLINAVLLLTFAIAYFVDYIVLRSSIGK